MLKVSGRVYESETGAGIAGLHVKAVDKDLLFDDVLGTAVTDGDGRFEISYDVADFRELFERTPDLYVVVRDAANQRTLFSSEREVKWRAGVDEYVDLPLSRAILQGSGGANPYGPHLGRVRLRLAPQGAAPPKQLRLLFLEHLPALRKQHVFSQSGEGDVEVELPSGEYSLQVFAPEFETLRGLVNVVAGQVEDVKFSLAPRQPKVWSFVQLLESYGVKAGEVKPQPLSVEANTLKILDYRSQEVSERSFKLLEARSIAQLKAWIGSDDRRFGHERPVFGRLPDAKLLAGLNEAGRDLRRLSPPEVEAVASLSQEYLHGNSKSVAAHEKLLDRLIVATKLEAVIKIPLHFYSIVTVAAGATLQLGNGSNLFACDELRVHKTGKVKAVNDVTVKVGTYKEFS